jgi:hypothetical protein
LVCSISPVALKILRREPGRANWIPTNTWAELQQSATWECSASTQFHRSSTLPKQPSLVWEKHRKKSCSHKEGHSPTGSPRLWMW